MLKKFEWLLNGAVPMLMAEAGNEGGAAADAAAGEGNQPEGQTDGGEGGEKEGAGNQPDFYRPEGLPDHLLGGDEKETMDKIMAAYQGARKELSKKQGVPEKLDDYKVELPEELAGKVLRPGEDGQDPVFEAMRAVMHENGVSADKAANIVEAFYGKVVEKMEQAGEEGGEGITLDKEFKTFGGLEKAQPVIDANKTWIQGLVNQGTITKEDAADMESNLVIGEGLAWMDKLRVTIGGGKPIPVDMSGDKTGGGEVTEKELQEMVKDPRYRVGSKTFDADYHAEVTKKYEKFYNGKS